MRVLLLNQAFRPDVVSSAQHLTDLAVGLSRAGHEVTVIAADRGYADPEQPFAARERWRGIDIFRVPMLGLGKTAKWRRALDFGSFFLSCSARLIRLPRFDVVVAMTSPPLISVLGAFFAGRWKAGLVFWVLDLNPDEALAAGWLRRGSAPSRLLDGLLGYSLRRSRRVIALDRFMKSRIAGKGVPEESIAIVPPWSHDGAVRFDTEGREAFRLEHGLTGKFVVMYSGNHSPCHPLDTLLEAADKLAARDEIRFCFVGGGSEQARVRSFAAGRGLANIVCLGYQPLEKLAGSLSAADLHVVVMGDPFVGIVHPCKIYNILAVGAPILYIGPTQSHIADILGASAGERPSAAARHGDGEGVARAIREMEDGSRRGGERRILGSGFSQDALVPRLVRIVEDAATEVGVERKPTAEKANAKG